MPLHVQDFVVPGHAVDEYDHGERDIEIARSFNRLLAQIDEKLFCFWVKADAQVFDHPARWHIGRLHSNVELNTYWVVQTETGGYREPGEQDLEWLRAHDSHTRNVLEDMRRARTWRQAQRKRDFEEKRREFREKLDERLRHLNGSQISVPRRASDPPVAKQDHLVLPPGAKVDRA